MMTTNSYDKVKPSDNYEGIELPKLGIYIHIPFCVKKCDYCDFLSFQIADEGVQRAYVWALQEEIFYQGKTYGHFYQVDTVFIGGGTPSLLSGSLIREILNCVKQNFNLGINSEITIECNPKTLSLEKLNDYRDVGINRISLGAQSFDDEVLHGLGRIHQASDIESAVGMIRHAGFENLNLDLMFAMPGHTAACWQNTLENALELRPEHVSFYGLQIEENTPLFDRVQRGKVLPISDEDSRSMYFAAIHCLEKAGYELYEISNAAKSDYFCAHNLKYWSMEDYLGVGLGSHSYLKGTRFANCENLREYLDNPPGEKSIFVHHNSRADTISEWMFTCLRQRSGISLKDFEKRFGQPIRDVFQKEWPAIERYIKDGFLILDGDVLRLSLEGILISNRILSEFILNAEEA